MKSIYALIVLALAIALPANAAPLAVEVHLEQRLGKILALDTELTDEVGHRGFLQEALGTRPIILVFAYYRCPNLCTLVLNGLTQTLRELPEVLGKDYRILTVSIDPTEKPPLALAKQRSYLARLGRSRAPDGSWHFLTGSGPEIRRLADSAGFHFRRDPSSGDYQHPSGIVIVSPRGKITQYFFGIQFDAARLRLALRAAAAEKRGSWVDEILLYCFHYDPALSRNGPLIMRAIRLMGFFGALGVLGLLLHLFSTEKRKRRA